MTESEHFDVPEHGLRVEDDNLWHAPASDIFEFFENADASLRAIEESTDVRVVVLEAWLLLDYVLRKFLLGGLCARTRAASGGASGAANTAD